MSFPKRAEQLREDIHRLVREYLEVVRQPFETNQLELGRATYGQEEVTAAIDVLLDDQLAMGPRVAQFERSWSRYLGVESSHMVNSGSSANLLMFSALAFPGIDSYLKPGDEVILPAVAWSTSLFPIFQVGCVPVLVDIDLNTLNLDPARVEEAITPRTKAILAVHVLGNPCDMNALLEIANRHHLWVVEDCCEAHAASIGGRHVGTFGELSSFSFFFSHHMTTVEGGIVSTKNTERWQDLLVSLRAHGWIRGRSDYGEWARKYPDIDPRWLFVTPGFNVRPTEISAAFGEVQLSKLPSFAAARINTRARLMERLKPLEEFFIFQRELPGHVHSAFAFSFLLRDSAPFSRTEFQAHLEASNIQTRPIIGSNLARQPVLKYVPHKTAGALPNANVVHERGVMIANHHNVTPAQEDYVVDCVDRFVSRHASVG